MRRLGILLTACTLTLAFFATGPTPAAAAGCGGIIDFRIRGCAPWDNNPMCPYHPNCRYMAPAPVPGPQPPRPGCRTPSAYDSPQRRCQLQKECDREICSAGCAGYRYSNPPYYAACINNCGRNFQNAMQYCPRY